MQNGEGVHAHHDNCDSFLSSIIWYSHKHLFNSCRMRKPTITQLLCDGNAHLESAPKNMIGDSCLLLSCLNMQQSFKDILLPKEAQRRELQDQSERLYTELAQVRRKMEKLEEEIVIAGRERPDRYIYWKRKSLDFMHRKRNMIMQWSDFVKRACQWLWEKQRTHPY